MNNGDYKQTIGKIMSFVHNTLKDYYIVCWLRCRKNNTLFHMRCNKKLLMFHIAIIFKQDNHTEMRRYFDLKLTQTVTTIDGIGAIAIHL